MSLPLLVTSALLATAPLPRCDPAPWSRLVRHHAIRYPGWELQDAYKLLHQAALGSEHAVPDPETPRVWLRQELATLGDGPDEPVVDTIGGFARIHLRPFVARGGDTARLLAAFVATANAPTERDTLECALTALMAEVRGGRLPWRADSVGAWLREKREAGYPAVGHGARYRAAHRPAYRVVGLEWVGAISER